MSGGKFVDYKKIETFLDVAQSGSFSKTAEKKYLSQRSVSKQITQLENEIGSTLFHRDKNKITLTEDGKIFLYTAQDIITSYMNSMNDFRELTKRPSTILRIGYFSAFEGSLLEKSLFSLLATNNNLKPFIKEESNEHLVQSLENGLLDMALSIRFGKPPINVKNPWKVTTIYEGEMVMGISKLNPLSHYTTLKVDDLKNQTILYYSTENSTFLLESIMVSMPTNVNYEQIRRVQSVEQMHMLVATNQAIACYPEGLLIRTGFKDDPYVDYLRVESDHPLTYDIVAITDKSPDKIVKKLLEELLMQKNVFRLNRD